MKTLREAGALELRWVQPRALGRAYELRAGEDTLATMRFTRWYGHRVVVETAGARWVLGPRGFFGRRVVVRAEETQSDVVTLELGWRGQGALDLGEGRVLRWANTRFWRGEWSFLSEAGEKLVTFRRKVRAFRHEAEVVVDPAAIALPELSMLLALGFYLVLLTAHRGAAH